MESPAEGKLFSLGAFLAHSEADDSAITRITVNLWSRFVVISAISLRCVCIANACSKPQLCHFPSAVCTGWRARGPIVPVGPLTGRLRAA